MSSMPTTEGKIGQSRVSVLRDTGCSGVVNASQYTGKEQTNILPFEPWHDCLLIYYIIGEVDAWCMETSLIRNNMLYIF